jgi:hypothetical protein
MRPLPRLLAISLVGVSCGGGTSGPSGTPTPAPTPVEPTFPVSGLVFYDANGNGRATRVKTGRCPG